VKLQRFSHAEPAFRPLPHERSAVCTRKAAKTPRLTLQSWVNFGSLFTDYLTMKMFAVALSAALALFASVSAQAQVVGDAKAGREKAQMCVGCHAIEGWRTAYPQVFHVPRIGGQHADYLVSALKAYKSGERSHPSMRAIAGSMSDKDMADLAAYYAASKK
jgi:cytochrome c553